MKSLSAAAVCHGVSRRYATAALFLVTTFFLPNAAVSQAAENLPPPRPCAQGECVPPLATASGSQRINWNPGVYFGFKPSSFENEDGSWKPASQVIGNNVMCKPGGENVKGVRIKLDWAEYEPNLGNYKGDELFDDVISFLSSGQCGGIPRQTVIQSDFFANNLAAREGRCVPAEHRNSTDMVSWTNDAGRDRCAARIWDTRSETLQNYRALWRHIAQRYGGSKYVERFGPKGEGALGVQRFDGDYDSNVTYTALRDLALAVRSWAPQIPTTLGSNNFQVGFDDLLISLYKEAMDNVGGMGLSWPDTWMKRAAPATRHHAYYNQFHNQHMLWGEWQRPEKEFDTFAEAARVCCDPDYVDPRADPNDFVPANPPTHAYGATHVAVITTWAAFPEEDALAMFNQRARGYNTFDMSCPDAWLAAGLQCMDNQDRVIP